MKNSLITTDYGTVIRMTSSDSLALILIFNTGTSLSALINNWVGHRLRRTTKIFICRRLTKAARCYYQQSENH